MTYNPNQYMNYEAGRGSIYSAPPKAKSTNANEEAAKSMGSVGIGGLGGKTTTSAAQKIQSDFFSSPLDNDNKGSTYDEVPQVVTKGLGAPSKAEPEEDDRNLDQKIYDMIKSFGGNLDSDPEPVYPMEVYESYMFRIPDPVEVTQETLADPFDAYNVDTYNLGGYNDTRDTAPYMSQTVDPDLQDPRRGLMRPPTMTQPATPGELTDVPRALAVSAAIPTETYLIKEGDTLSEIARDKNTTVEAIMKANSQIVDKDEIEAGATIEIPKEDDGLTPTQRALRAGLDKDKDMNGVEVAFVGTPVSGLSYLNRFFGNPPKEDTGGYDEMPSIYSKAVNSMSSLLKEREGTKPHIGADWDNVTLALGIVPDKGLKINGEVVPADRAARGKWLKKNKYVNALGLPTLKFRLANVDTSGVVKNGVKRSDFNNDEEWSKAVINNFEQAPKEAFKDYETLSTSEQKALIDTAWNMGKASLEYSGVKSLLNEAAKPTEDRDRNNILEIAKHNTQGGKAMRGLVRRRVLTANEFIDNPSEKIAQIRQTSDANNTYFTFIDANGTAVKTIKSNKKHRGSPDGLIDVATGNAIEETTSIRPQPRPLGLPTTVRPQPRPENL